MIFITAAMVSEARPVIDRFNLKNNGSENRFRIYENETIKLIITGVGATKAMIATVYLLTRYGAKKTDCLLNLGIAALYKSAKTETGQIFIASSIENTILKRSFYPDMLLVTPFAQAKVVTFGEVYFSHRNSQDSSISKNSIGNNCDDVSRDDNHLIDAQNDMPSACSNHNYEYVDEYVSSPVLIDMEAAFVYEAASGFIYSHNVFVLKIISDSGDPESLLPVKITSLIDMNMDKIEEFINLLIEWSSMNLKPETITESDRKVVEEISDSLRLTQYQRIEFLNLSEMYVIRGKDLKADLGSFTGISQVKQKRDGKEFYDKIRKILLQP